MFEGYIDRVKVCGEALSGEVIKGMAAEPMER
jgi:hypothetical protein